MLLRNNNDERRVYRAGGRLGAMSKKSLLLGAIGLLVLSASGCVPLTIASLAFQAYKYHKTGEIFGIQTRPDPQAPTSSNAASNASSPNAGSSAPVPAGAAIAPTPNVTPFMPGPDDIE